MKTISIVSKVFLVVGILMLIGAYFTYSNTSDFLKTADKSFGMVIDYQEKESRDSDGHYSMMYYPVVAYVLEDGTPLQFVSSTGSGRPTYLLNQQIDIYVSSENPGDARIASFFSLWGGTTILGGLGLVFALIGGGMIFFSKKDERDEIKAATYTMQVEADVKGVFENTNIEVNGRCPLYIEAQWLDEENNQLHIS